MKNNIINVIFSFIIGALLFSAGIVFAEVVIHSSSVIYDPKDSNWHVDNVENAINDLYTVVNDDNYITKDTIVSNWLNEQYTVSTIWTSFNPTVYNESFVSLNSDKSVSVVRPGLYRFYYQSISDSQNYAATIRILVNGTQIATCGSTHGRCANELLYVDSELHEGDTILIQVKTGNASWGARPAVSMVYKPQNE